MPLRARVAPLLLLCLVLASPAAPPAAEEVAREPRIERLGRLPKELAESSGVAASRAQPGVLWTHDDSGGGAKLYAIDAQGTVLGRYLVRGARAEDWEDIALGRCPGRDASCLFVADTGDNLEQRRSVSIQIVKEPEVPKAPEAQWLLTELPQSVELRYPDGPHDVEAIAFDPDGNLLLVSKGQRSPIRVYRVARAELAKKSAQADLVDRDTVAPRSWLGAWVTGAATSPSKQRLAVRTYNELYFYRFGAKTPLVPDGPPCELGFVEPQGEGVDFLDEDTLVLTSESRGGRVGEILRVTCPR
jgi:hypothetical protein